MAEPPVIDVEALVEDLRGRVARAKAEGLYGDDLSGVALRAPAPEARVRFRPELAYSTKPLVGKPLTAVKKVLIRLLVHVFDDLARQADAGIAAAEGAARDARAWAEQAAAAEAAARERVAADVAALAGADRRARGAARAPAGRARAWPGWSGAAAPAPAAPAAAAAAAPAPAPSDQGVDYLAFEARFRGAEETVRERQEVYRRHLEGRRRAVDLGCGRGELLELMRDAGVAAYGVDTEPDFVDLVEEKGLEVRREDAVAHVEGLAAGEVDAIVASHLVEHLPPGVVARLVGAAADALAEGGILIVETPNPESLVAGSINFHRDPTHLRPVHPETLAFLCESAGFSEVEILRLSPVPDPERLPRAGTRGRAAGAARRPAGRAAQRRHLRLAGLRRPGAPLAGMRILWVVPRYGRGIAGGAETLVRALADALRGRGLERRGRHDLRPRPRDVGRRAARGHRRRGRGRGAPLPGRPPRRAALRGAARRRSSPAGPATPTSSSGSPTASGRPGCRSSSRTRPATTSACCRPTCSARRSGGRRRRPSAARCCPACTTSPTPA